MHIGTKLYTLFNGKLVGKDAFGNCYYQTRFGRYKRWVAFKGIAEPSKVPAEWHGWLHYTADVTPIEQPVKKWKWIKPSLPNLTGTKGAYFPDGDLRRGGKRKKVSADYQPWQP